MKIKLIDFGYEKLPERKHYNDTGADVYVTEKFEIQPQETKVIPVGFGIELPDGCNAHFQTRTSIAKRGLFVQQCAIDAGYRGEWAVLLYNHGHDIFTYKAGDRVCQVVFNQLPVVDIQEGPVEIDGDRFGGFGSTGVA